VVTHVRFGGLDGYFSVVLLEDALAEDVLLADRLDGRPLHADHGAPLRLVSPRQYGYINTKHLSRVDVLTAAPAQPYRTATRVAQRGLRALGFTPHPRARVWEEERGGLLPNAVARPLYRLLTPPIRALSAKGSR
jgi:DMSO/TMAO reductase YedYZ molybdopterin-dependent catalytic subunit